MSGILTAVFQTKSYPELTLNKAGFLGFTGLRYRMSLPKNEAMLFDFGYDADHTFWMADVSIPLDLLFLDSQGVVVHIHENAVPNTRYPISSGKAVRSVIETNAGWCSDNGITVGTIVRYRGIC